MGCRSPGERDQSWWRRGFATVVGTGTPWPRARVGMTMLQMRPAGWPPYLLFHRVGPDRYSITADMSSICSTSYAEHP
jgi:hypothetical protein